MAIKILKEGDRSKSKVMQFTCKNCGCIFECDHDEIHNEGVMCPTCWNGISLFDSDTYTMAVNNMVRFQKNIDCVKSDMFNNFDLTKILNHIKDNWSGPDNELMPDIIEIKHIVDNIIAHTMKSKSKQSWENFESYYEEQDNICSITISYIDGEFKVQYTSTIDMLTSKII